MRKFICVSMLLTLLANGSMNAQTGVRFGLSTAYCLATQYGIKPADNSYTVSSDGRSGFSGGVFVYFPITESVGVKQEFLYSMKGSRQNVTIPLPVNINTVSEYNLNYFEMPVSLKYKFVKIKNFGIYGSFGISLSLLMNGAYDITSQINMGGPPVVVNETGNMKGVDTFDYSFVYATGTDFKMLKKDFFFEYRMTVGWNTLALPNAKGAEPVPLRNMGYIFGLGMYL